MAILPDWSKCIIDVSQMEREGYFHRLAWARVQHPVSLLALPDGEAFGWLEWRGPATVFRERRAEGC